MVLAKIGLNKYIYKWLSVYIGMKSEIEGMKETIDVLQDPYFLKQILESEENIKRGKIKKLDI